MTHRIAKEDRDLTPAYHGSGEHVARSVYRYLSAVMIPHKCVIFRYENGETYPFLDARITAITFGQICEKE
ncbi:MAG: hypothetical protein R8G34_13975 [Paracoccaceae bacterium]|nr:hypothetical protein [Paracoccaceae bacterium]